MTPRWGRFLAIGLPRLSPSARHSRLVDAARRLAMAAGDAGLGRARRRPQLSLARALDLARSPDARLARFMRFQLTNGLASLAGNAALMALFTGALGMPPLPANALAVVVMSAANFVTADRWVFRAAPLALRVRAAGAGRRGGTARGRPGGVGALRGGHRTRLDRARMSSLPRTARGMRSRPAARASACRRARSATGAGRSSSAA